MRYHIKAALNKSHSIESFKQNLNRIANRAEFSNATRVLIREIEQNLPKSGEGGGANTANEIKALDSQSEAPVKVIDEAQPVKAQEPLLARETLKSQDFKAKATELYNTAKAQEVEFKEFLENLKSANNSLELGQILKSEASIESKIARKAGDISDISDYLRAAIISKDKAHLDTELVKLEDSLKSRGIKPTIELQHRNASGYKGVHIQFEFNSVPSEIQIHTAKNWGIKKQMDSIYHVLREQGIRQTLKDEEIEELKRKSKALAQGLDLDISDLTSFKVNSPVKGSEKSVLVRKSSIDLKGDQNPPLKSYSNRAPYDADIAYNRPESPLNQKESLEGGKGNIDKPLSSSIQATTPPLKSQEINTNNYIDVEVIDHPKALPFKSDGQIYKEAKAKGLSYAEFKALREQEQATKALHTTRYIEFKKAENQNIKDLLDTSKPLRMLKPDQITERLLDQVKKHNAKVWVGELKDLTLANQLKLDTNHPIKITFNGSALAHVEKQHGNTSIHYLKNKQPPIGIQDIRDYPKVVNSADAIKLETTRDNQKALVAGKQINGYFIVVETISRKQNELKLKTMYKENGKLENSPIFKDSGLSSRLLTSSEDSLSPKPSVNLDARPQVTASDNNSLPLKNQDELAPEVQELLAKDKIKWYYKKAINKHLGLENGDYIPNLSPDVKNILNCTATN
ncbi:hypothetical protein [Helicobacter suis]|uniref:PBECR3 domain-containing polyvalent protein n=1 Tax=Helicobacter suis TaxID=104628 RepID=UPI0013D50362|nr:hypothetical protein [Helicobacter suis]